MGCEWGLRAELQLLFQFLNIIANVPLEIGCIQWSDILQDLIVFGNCNQLLNVPASISSNSSKCIPVTGFCLNRPSSWQQADRNGHLLTKLKSNI